MFIRELVGVEMGAEMRSERWLAFIPAGVRGTGCGCTSSFGDAVVVEAGSGLKPCDRCGTITADDGAGPLDVLVGVDAGGGCCPGFIVMFCRSGVRLATPTTGTTGLKDES
jgi:hypothetical protein